MAQERETRPAQKPPNQRGEAPIQRVPEAASQAEPDQPQAGEGLEEVEVVEGETPEGAVEVVEAVVEEEEEAPVINLPLALSFMTGAIGFLVIFFVSFLSGSHVLVALFWGAAGFFSLAVLGFLLDSVLNMLQTPSAPVVAPVESELAEPDGAGDEAGPAEQGALGATVNVLVDDQAGKEQAPPGGTESAAV